MLRVLVQVLLWQLLVEARLLLLMPVDVMPVQRRLWPSQLYKIDVRT